MVRASRCYRDAVPLGRPPAKRVRIGRRLAGVLGCIRNWPRSSAQFSLPRRYKNTASFQSHPGVPSYQFPSLWSTSSNSQSCSRASGCCAIYTACSPGRPLLIFPARNRRHFGLVCIPRYGSYRACARSELTGWHRAQDISLSCSKSSPGRPTSSGRSNMAASFA